MMRGGSWTIGDVVTRRRDGKRFKLKSLCDYDCRNMRTVKRADGKWTSKGMVCTAGPLLVAEDGEEVQLPIQQWNSLHPGYRPGVTLYDMFIPPQPPRGVPDERLLPEYNI